MAKDKTISALSKSDQRLELVIENCKKNAKSLKTHWYLLLTLSVHDFKSQYLGSILGLFWTIIKPLTLIGIYAIIFSSVMTTITNEKGEPFNFGLYIFAGMLPWLAIQESLQRGTTAFIDFSHMVKHHTFPLNLLPFHIVLSATVSELIAIVVFLSLKWLFNGNITSHCLLILGIIPIQVVFCFGLALVTATLNVFLRDISHLTTTILFIWFFTSPIVFSLEHFPVPVQKILWLNPLTSLTMLYRDLLLVGRMPSVETLLLFVLFSALFLMIGVYIYNKTRKAIVDWV
jgi:lipopolysaccharide transport system permease protein